MKKHFLTVLILIIGITMFNFFSNSNSVDISADEFKQKLESNPGVVIDVRTQDEYNAGHLKITDAQHDFLNGDFQNQLESFDKDKTYYLYCRSGNRSGQAARIMQNKGFENVYNVGGFDDLVSNGFEPNRPENE